MSNEVVKYYENYREEDRITTNNHVIIVGRKK